MRRSQRTVCIGMSLTQNGFRIEAYAIALSSGNPSEKKEMR